MPKRVRALLLACHPGPSAVVTAVAIVLGIALGYPPARLVLLAAAVGAGQLSIGWSNDWIDSARDVAVHRTDKPVASGAISAGAVRAAAFTALAVAIVLSLLLGPLAATANLLGVVAGWSYNLGLKSTVYSVLPYIVCFGLLPAVATLGQERPAFAAPWVMIVGALLGVAAHFTNVLPDLDDDRRTGVRGLPHRLGRATSGVLAFAALAAAGILLGLAPGLPPRLIGWIGMAATFAIAVWGIVLIARARSSRTLMRLVMAGALIDVAMLALSGQSLTA
ncbi:UbiA family prenyltransferase [Rathayibacter soli]|uniref:UbiA family prenyltransferase n=1 Tax=Rathayibacter soli TaxID=3144168 RepID=UPI0027E5B1A3|nr:UbiA family prenyltransferase [Glaciibacter superstes]